MWHFVHLQIYKVIYICCIGLKVLSHIFFSFHPQNRKLDVDTDLGIIFTGFIPIWCGHQVLPCLPSGNHLEFVQTPKASRTILTQRSASQWLHLLPAAFISYKMRRVEPHTEQGVLKDSQRNSHDPEFPPLHQPPTAVAAICVEATVQAKSFLRCSQRSGPKTL